MIKKLFPALVLISFLVVLIAPAAVFAATDLSQCKLTRTIDVGTDPNCPVATAAAPKLCPYDNTGIPPVVGGATVPCGMCCLLQTVYNILDWMFVVLVAAVGLLVLLGAFSYLTSAGSPEGTKKGRDYIMYAAIGLVLAFLARAVPAVVRMVVGA